MVLSCDEIAYVGRPIATHHLAMPMDPAVDILALISVGIALPLTMPMEKRIAELACICVPTVNRKIAMSIHHAVLELSNQH